MPPMEPEEKTKQTPIQKDFDDLIVQEETDKEPKEIFEPVQPNASKKSFVNKDKNTPSKPVEILPQVRTKEGDYKFPPVSLLEKGKKTAGNNKEELRQTAQKLQKHWKISEFMLQLPILAVDHPLHSLNYIQNKV